MSGVFVCCSCIPDTPVENDPRKGFANTWQINMGESPMKNPGQCLFGCMCAPCAAFIMRRRVLRGDMSKYTCFQNYFSFCCLKPGNCGESSAPECCLCLESFCCLGCAISANKFAVMDQYNIVSDPCDNRIIRFNNCIQLLSCILDIIAIFVSEARDAAAILDCIAKLVFYTTAGCMNAQLDAELKFRDGVAGGVPQQQAPMQQEMSRAPNVQTV